MISESKWDSDTALKKKKKKEKGTGGDARETHSHICLVICCFITSEEGTQVILIAKSLQISYNSITTKFHN